MQEDPVQKAVAEALAGNWKEASLVNLEIIKENPKDVDALNRLARAQAEMGNFKKAQTTSKKVLKIDPTNTIAVRCLAKWKGLKKGSGPIYKGRGLGNEFLEEPGKTKMVTLLHTGSSNVLAELTAGDEVKLEAHAHRVNVVTADGRYIGRMPDDLSARLRNLLKSGNLYRVLIKSTLKNEVGIFIREIARGKDAAKTQSFPVEKIDYIAFTSPELVRKIV